MRAERKSTTTLELNVSLREFKKVAEYVKKSKCRYKILEKNGMPFFWHKYKKRKIFIILFFLVLLSLIIMSKFIWNIEISGNNTIGEQEILSIINSSGVKIGSYKNSIDTKKIVDQIRIQRPDISWVGIKIVGTIFKVEIVEADPIPELVDESDYCNIVAEKDCMIEEISAQNGTLQVKKGDVVKAGTILIAGWMEGKYTGVRYVHSVGEVKGKVWYSEKDRVYLKQTEQKETGNVEKRYSLNVNKFAINFYKTLSNFEIYDTIRTEKKLKISSSFYLPIGITISENYEKIEEEKDYTLDEAKEIGVNKLTEKLESQIKNKDDIVNKYINTNESDEYVEVEVIYEVLENIGTEEKIAM